MERNRNMHRIMRLFEAVSRNHASIVESLLEFELPVNMLHPQLGWTTLFIAVLNNNIQIAKMLLKNGADPNIDEDVTPLYVAVNHGSERMVDLLVASGAKLNHKMRKSGKTALQLAVESNETDIAALLIFHGANTGLSTIEDMPLLYVAMNNKNEPLSLVLARCSSLCNRTCNDALYYAVESGYIAVAQELINKGADVNFFNLLLTAVKNRDRKMVEMLIRNGAKMEVSNDGLPLHYAINQRYKEIVTLLLDSGVAKISDYNVDGLTGLHVAVLSGNLDMCKLCIDYGADVNSLCLVNRQTSLYYATANGNRKMVKLLLENGANFNLWICDCSTLLDHALISRNEAIARMFIEKGAIINLFRVDEGNNTYMAIKILAQLVFRNSDMQKIAKPNVDSIQKSINYREYYELCIQELSKMREVTIFNNVTFYDLMSPNANKIAAYVRNKEFVQKFELGEYKNIFPIYSSVLSLKYTEARVRSNLLKEAEERFGGLKEFRLPNVCAQKVLEYVENEELKHFIRGTCQCKGKHTCGSEMLIAF